MPDLFRQASFRALKALNADEHVDAPENSDEKKAVAKKRQRYIQPIVDNFRRNKKGVKLMVQEMDRLLAKQCKLFPNRAMVDLDDKICTFTYNGQTGTILKEELLTKTPVFFDHYFLQVKKKVEFGAKVQGWLSRIETKMANDYRFKDLHELVSLIANSEFTETTGFVQDDESSGAEA